MPPGSSEACSSSSKKRKRRKTTVDDEGKIPRSLTPSLSHEHLGITQEAFLILLWFQVPLEFLHVLAFMFMRPEYSNNSDFFLVEYFCGVAAIVEAWQSRELPAAGFDINHSALHQDLTLPHGMVAAMQWLRRVLRNGMGASWFATVCSSWIFLSSPSTGRRFDRPEGNTLHWSVRHSNTMVCRTNLLMVFCYAVNIAWCLEQPHSSVMTDYQSFVFMRHMAERIGLEFFEVYTCMGAFNAPSLKPSCIFGSHNWVQELRRMPTSDQRRRMGKTKVAVTAVCPHTGRKTVTGGPGLKDTQKYTRDFGHMVADAFFDAPAVVRDIRLPADIAEKDLEANAVWDDAGMGAVWSYLMGRRDGE